MRVLACLWVCVLAGCGTDRPRPGPAEPPGQAALSVRIIQPAEGASVLGGRELQVRVEGRDLQFESLTGIGLVVRRTLSTIDSQVVRFPPRTDSLHVFLVSVPDVSLNTPLDLQAMAFGVGTTPRRSDVRSVIAIPCAPSVPGCVTAGGVEIAPAGR